MIITCYLEHNSIFDLNSSPIVLQRPVKEVGVTMNAPATVDKRMIRSMDNRCMLLSVSNKQPMVRRGVCYLQQRARDRKSAGGSSTIDMCILYISFHPLVNCRSFHQLGVHY